MILPGKFSNPDDEAASQAEIYKKIDTETAKSIISATHHTNGTIHDISTILSLCMEIY